MGVGSKPSLKRWLGCSSRRSSSQASTVLVICLEIPVDGSQQQLDLKSGGLAAARDVQ
jgi:hypothetical protein